MHRRDFEARLIAKAWQDEKFREELKRDPRGVLSRELAGVKEGAGIPGNVQIEVLEETPEKLYLVIPSNPLALLDAKLDESQLVGIAGGTGGTDASTVSVSTVTTAVSTVLDNGIVIAYVNVQGSQLTALMA